MNLARGLGLPFANLPRIERKSSQTTSASSILMRKYGFDEHMAQEVSDSLGNSMSLINAFASMALPIKGMGFRREEIVEIVAFFGESALDKANWSALQALKAHTKNTETAVYAYKAGLSPYDVKTLSEEEMSIENLKVMAQLRNI